MLVFYFTIFCGFFQVREYERSEISLKNLPFWPAYHIRKMMWVDRISQKALISLYFCAVLTYGRKRISVNFGFVFVNLCKLFMQKWSVLHFGTDHLRKLLFSPSLFFDYSDVYFDKIASIKAWPWSINHFLISKFWHVQSSFLCLYFLHLILEHTKKRLLLTQHMVLL